jgi:hypothetical protein
MGIPTNGGPPPPPPNPCTAPACLNAKAELATARTAFEQTCKGLKTVASILRILKPIVSISLWYLVVIVIVAIVLFWLGLGWIAILLWALVLIYLVAWLVYLAFARVAASLAKELSDRAKAVQDAIAKVVAGCPENCRGDLSIPSCDVELP